MEVTMIQEATDILKKLSPKNQAYFMTLARVAETAENGVKSAINRQTKNEQTPQPNPHW